MLEKLFAKPILCGQCQLKEHSKSGKKTCDVASKFENDVIEYLQQNGYEVDRTIKPVDGVAMKNGHNYIVEVKYVIGWQKACEAQWEIATCLRRGKINVKGAVVFFNQFNADWGSAPKYLGRPKGWDLWYRDHADVNGVKAHLVRFDAEGRLPAIHPLASI